MLSLLSKYVCGSDHIIIKFFFTGIFVHFGKMLQDSGSTAALALAIPETPGMPFRRPSFYNASGQLDGPVLIQFLYSSSPVTS